mmetsp:Transcript_39406/g.85354  ORF Transcript_39406/g.85354 Transcript_39406/m.85354 type:complete len:131 (-) Transcript_39406:31-423(-)
MQVPNAPGENSFSLSIPHSGLSANKVYVTLSYTDNSGNSWETRTPSIFVVQATQDGTTSPSSPPPNQAHDSVGGGTWSFVLMWAGIASAIAAFIFILSCIGSKLLRRHRLDRHHRLSVGDALPDAQADAL